MCTKSIRPLRQSPKADSEQGRISNNHGLRPATASTNWDGEVETGDLLTSEFRNALTATAFRATIHHGNAPDSLCDLASSPADHAGRAGHFESLSRVPRLSNQESGN